MVQCSTVQTKVRSVLIKMYKTTILKAITNIFSGDISTVIQYLDH